MSESLPGEETDVSTSPSNEKGSQICPECGDGFDSEQGLKVHYGVKHDGKLRNTVPCDNCGASLKRAESEINDTNFCDYECLGEYRSKISGEEHHLYEGRITVYCENCGEELERRKWRIEKHDKQFCDQSCQGEYLQNITGDDHPSYSRVEYDCDNCGKMMERKPSRVESHKFLYCSNECQNSHEELQSWLSDQRKNSIEVTCEICSGDFEVIPFRKDTAKYCSRECRIEATRQITGEERYNYKRDKTDNFGEGWEQLSERIRDKYNRTCQVCGVAENNVSRRLDVHHIIPRSAFDDIKDANDEDNLVPLCRSCHKKWEGIPVRPKLI